ncbi:MAG: MFS transporter [Pseudomonadota bacterium]
MTREKKVDPRYAIVFGACLTQFTVIGLLFSYGLFFKTFETEFGWSRTTLSGGASLAFFMMGVLATGLGYLSDRFGPTPVLGMTGVLFGFGFALIAWVSEPWHLFVIFGLFIGLGMSTHDVVTLSSVARWFDKRRGMMTGVVKTGTAIGQVVVPPVAALIMASFGWRMAAILMGVIAAALLLAAALLMKKPPPPKAAPSSASTPPRGLNGDGDDFRAVTKTRVFWTLCAIQFLFLPTLTTIPLHIAVHGMDLGMSAPLAAVLLSVVGASSVVGRLTIGAFSDRIGGKRGFILCFVPLIASLLALLAITTPWMLFAAIALYGFGHGGLFTIVAPTIAEFFGTKAHGAIFGAIVFFGTIGGALGPILAGRIFDVTQSYDLAFMTLAGMTVLGLMLVISLPRPKRQSTPGSVPLPSENAS